MDMPTLEIDIGRQVLTAQLDDSQAARDFVSLLPLTMTLNDLFRREKYGRLPRPISESGPRKHAYDVGELIYWSPGPDVAIFYRHDGQGIPEPGVIVLGKITGDLQALSRAGSLKATIRIASPNRDRRLP